MKMTSECTPRSSEIAEIVGGSSTARRFSSDDPSAADELNSLRMQGVAGGVEVDMDSVSMTLRRETRLAEENEGRRQGEQAARAVAAVDHDDEMDRRIEVSQQTLQPKF